MATYLEFQVGTVHRLTAGGWGFNITGQHRQPVFGIAYASEREAEAARDALEKALANAVEVTSYP